MSFYKPNKVLINSGIRSFGTNTNFTTLFQTTLAAPSAISLVRAQIPMLLYTIPSYKPIFQFLADTTPVNVPVNTNKIYTSINDLITDINAAILNEGYSPGQYVLSYDATRARVIMTAGGPNGGTILASTLTNCNDRLGFISSQTFGVGSGAVATANTAPQLINSKWFDIVSNLTGGDSFAVVFDPVTGIQTENRQIVARILNNTSSYGDILNYEDQVVAPGITGLNTSLISGMSISIQDQNGQVISLPQRSECIFEFALLYGKVVEVD